MEHGVVHCCFTHIAGWFIDQPGLRWGPDIVLLPRGVWTIQDIAQVEPPALTGWPTMPESSTTYQQDPVFGL